MTGAEATSVLRSGSELTKRKLGKAGAYNNVRIIYIGTKVAVARRDTQPKCAGRQWTETRMETRMRLVSSAVRSDAIHRGSHGGGRGDSLPNRDEPAAEGASRGPNGVALPPRVVVMIARDCQSQIQSSRMAH